MRYLFVKARKEPAFGSDFSLSEKVGLRPTAVGLFAHLAPFGYPDDLG
jgi:hypothetical protein